MKQKKLTQQQIYDKVKELKETYIRETGIVPNRCNCDVMLPSIFGMDCVLDESEISVSYVMKDFRIEAVE
jgi:hypothetical protein